MRHITNDWYDPNKWNPTMYLRYNGTVLEQFWICENGDKEWRKI